MINTRDFLLLLHYNFPVFDTMGTHNISVCIENGKMELGLAAQVGMFRFSLDDGDLEMEPGELLIEIKRAAVGSPHIRMRMNNVEKEVNEDAKKWPDEWEFTLEELNRLLPKGQTFSGNKLVSIGESEK